MDNFTKQGVSVVDDKIEGYAVTFFDHNDKNSEYRMGENVVERVDPNCKFEFSKNVIADWDHDEKQYLASTRNNTLELKIDNKGLFYSAKIPNTTAGRDALELAKRNDCDGSSFRFDPSRSVYNVARDGNMIVRNFIKLFIERVSPVFSAAYKSSVRCSERSENSDDIKNFLEREKMLKIADSYTK